MNKINVGEMVYVCDIEDHGFNPNAQYEVVYISDGLSVTLFNDRHEDKDIFIGNVCKIKDQELIEDLVLLSFTDISFNDFKVEESSSSIMVWLCDERFIQNRDYTRLEWKRFEKRLIKFGYTSYLSIERVGLTNFFRIYISKNLRIKITEE